MAVIPVGFAQATAVFTIPGDSGPANVVTGHDVSALSTAVAVADAIQDGWQAGSSALINMLSSQVTLAQLVIYWRANAGDPVVINRTVNDQGNNGGSMAPPQVCYLLDKVTGLAGRHNRGRTYLPGVTESDVDQAGVLAPSVASTMAGNAAGCLSNWATADAPMVILHTNPAIAPAQVVAWEPATKVGTQRRRLR